MLFSALDIMGPLNLEKDNDSFRPRRVKTAPDSRMSPISCGYSCWKPSIEANMGWVTRVRYTRLRWIPGREEQGEKLPWRCGSYPRASCWEALRSYPAICRSNFSNFFFLERGQSLQHRAIFTHTCTPTLCHELTF